ncbi:hypothetical protein Btru_029252 [Bulinus truncatus]|nr:hypothetical protein Btru_029252 [Bulinus truncatus]
MLRLVEERNGLKLMYSFLSGTAKVTLDISSPLEVDLCSRTVIPVSCKVSTSHVYPGTLSVLYINNDEHQARTTYERDASHALTFNFLPSTIGQFEVRCSVMNNHTYAQLAEEIIFLNVTGGNCGISSVSLGLAVGLGCAVFVLLVIILTFALWRRRKTVARRQEKQTVYFTVGDNQVKVIVQSNSQVEPPPDYMSHAEYDRRTYLPRVSTHHKSNVHQEYDNPTYMGSDSSSYLFLSRQSSSPEVDNNIYSTVDG